MKTLNFLTQEMNLSKYENISGEKFVYDNSGRELGHHDISLCITKTKDTQSIIVRVNIEHWPIKVSIQGLGSDNFDSLLKQAEEKSLEEYQKSTNGTFPRVWSIIMPIEPNSFDNKRLADIRSGQTDPIVQYYIVRTDLGMSAGKIAAQVAHGAQMFMMSYLGGKKDPLVEDWINGSFRKVMLGAKKKDFDKIKNELNVFLARDAGLTEIEPNSETVLVLWPMLKSDQPKCLRRLQAL